MKVVSFISGLAIGMAAAAAAVSAMYPDIPKRMKRDGKHMMRAVKKMVCFKVGSKSLLCYLLKRHRGLPRGVPYALWLNSVILPCIIRQKLG